MSTQDPQPNRKVSWRSPEIVGEIVLLAVVLALAIAFIADMGKLKWPARYLPIITMLFATPFWLARIKTLIDRKHSLEAGQIMDLGFRFGGDPVAEKQRAIRYIIAVACLFLGVWAFGFHIALPLWVMSYLFLFAKLKPLAIIMIGIAFEGLLLGVHDFIIDVPWPQPLFFQLIGLEYIFDDWPISETY